MEVKTLDSPLVFSPKNIKLSPCELSTLLAHYSKGKLSDQLEYSDEDLLSLYERYSKAYFDDAKVYKVFGALFMDRGMHRQALSCLYTRLYLIDKGSKEFNDTWKLVNSLEEALVSEVLELPRSFIEDMFLREPNFNFSVWKSKMAYTDDLTPYSYGTFTQDGSFTSVSTRSLRPGDLIFKVTPFVVAPWDFDSKVLSDPSVSRENTYCCFHCLSVVNKSLDSLQESGVLIACSKHPGECNFYFCSPKCFLNNGAVHFMECDHLMKLLKFSESFLSPSLVLLVLRTLIKCSFTMESTSRVCDISSEPPTPNELLDTLLSSNVDYSILSLYHPYIMDHVDRFASFLLEEIGFDLCLHLTPRELRHLTLVLWVNSVPFTSYLNYSFDGLANTMGGTAFSFQPLQFRQSNTPNCVLHFDDNGKLTMRSIYEVPSGCELTFNAFIDKYLPPFIQNTRFWSCSSLFYYNPKEFEYFRDTSSLRCNNCVKAFCHSVNYVPSVDSGDEECPFGLPGGLRGRIFDRELGTEQTPFLRYQWRCEGCSSPISEELDLLFNKAQNVFNEALRMYFRGEYLPCRNLLVDFVTRWSGVLQPSHYLMYNSYVLLAGILMNRPGGNMLESLTYLRKAIIHSDQLLPAVCHERAYLYERFADYLVNMKVYCRLGNEEYKRLKSTIMEALYKSLWNWTVISGSDSYQSVTAMQKCRRVGFALNVHCFPLSRQLVVSPTTSYFNVFKSATGSRVIPESLVDKLNNNLSLFLESSSQGGVLDSYSDSDIASVTFVAAQSGESSEEAVGVLNAVQANCLLHLGTGLSMLGIAASNLNLDLFSRLSNCLYDSVVENLEVIAESTDKSEEVVKCEHRVSNLLYSLIGANELGVDPLIALASAPYPVGVSSEEGDVSIMATREMAVARVVFGHLSKLRSLFESYRSRVNPEVVSESFYKFLKSENDFRRMVVNRVTHSVLKGQSALHYAACRGKAGLTEFLVRQGSEVDALNLDGASPLHLAAFNGHPEVISTLVSFKANILISLKTGETALHLAAYGLHKEAVRVLLELYRGRSLEVFGPTVWHSLVCGLFSENDEGFGLTKTTTTTSDSRNQGFNSNRSCNHNNNHSSNFNNFNCNHNNKKNCNSRNCNCNHNFNNTNCNNNHNNNFGCVGNTDYLKKLNGVGNWKHGNASNGSGKRNFGEMLSERLERAVEICRILAEEMKEEGEGVLRVGIWADYLPSQLLEELWRRTFEKSSLFSFPRRPTSVFVISKPRFGSDRGVKGEPSVDLEGHRGLYGYLKESKCEVNNYREVNERNDSAFIATRTFQFLVEMLKSLEGKKSES